MIKKNKVDFWFSTESRSGGPLCDHNNLFIFCKNSKIAQDIM